MHMSTRRLLEKTIRVKGKSNRIHANLIKTDLFQHNHEIVELAMMVGILFEKRERASDEIEDVQSISIGKETMRDDAGKKIIDLYRFCMLLHEPYIDIEERMQRAFGYDENGEEAEQYEDILFSYMRGGYSILEEKILNYGIHPYHKKQRVDFVRAEYTLHEEINQMMQKKLEEYMENQPMSSLDIISRA